VPAGTVYWHAALYQPPAPEVAAPAGISLRWAKARYVFADASGKSLFTPAAAATCAGGCQGLHPFPAPLAAQPVGAWRPVQEKDGQRVWSYRGRVVYQASDAEPAAGADWKALEPR
jgi:predicted lipoprotein with Yx(FWY)xxD motif